MEKTVLILGARGRLGGAVALAFARHGWRVVAQRRAGGAAPRVAHPGIEWRQVDLADTTALAAAARGASVVVHATNPASYTAAAWQAQMPKLTQQAIDVALALGALLLFPGNVYNYGAQMPALLTPQTPQRPTTAKGRIRVALEQQLAVAVREQGLKAVVIRAGDFFGSGGGSWLDQVIVKKLREGRITWPGRLDLPHAWAYLPDLAEVFVRVAETTPGRLGGALESLTFPGLTLTGAQWIEALTDVAWDEGWLPRGGRLQISRLPWGLMALAAPFSPMMASLREMRYLWDTPHALDGQALAARIGPVTPTPLAQGLAAALADLGLTRPVDANLVADAATPSSAAAIQTQGA